MKKIGLSNYEAFLLDYLEGNLSAENTADLLLFLEQNPDLKVELESLSEIILSPDKAVIAEFKEGLHQTESRIKHRFHELAIALYDQSISGSEKQELDNLIVQYPLLEKEFNALGNTYLKPDYSVIFTNKSSLQKQFLPVSGFEHMAIRELEGLSSASESLSFQSLVKSSPKFMSEWKAFQKTKLEKEPIPFFSKQALYKGGSLKSEFSFAKRALAIAATLLLLAGMFSLLNRKENAKNQPSVLLTGGSIPVNKTSPSDSVIHTKQADRTIKAPTKEQERTPQKPQRDHSVNCSPSKADLSAPYQIAELKSIPAFLVNQFELETNYLSQLTPYAESFDRPSMLHAESKSLTIGQFLANKFRKAAMKRGYDLPKSIDKENLTKNGIKELEGLTNGIVSITRDETPDGRKVNGFSIGPLAFRRSYGNN
jgi:hypothetical protein